MLKYILGFLKNIFNPAVSFFALIDSDSFVSNKAKIYRGTKILNSKIDSYSYITKGTSVIFTEMGKFCSIGHNSIIGLPNHTIQNVSTSPIFTEKNNATKHCWINTSTEYPYKKIFIGNDVWIGDRVIIKGGISIGNGVVIGAGSIVTKDIPDYAIVAGVPAKIIRYRFEESVVKKLLQIQWWNLPEHFLKENIQIFNKMNFNIQDLDKVFKLNNLQNIK